MTKAPISLQDLRRKIYLKSKADKTWRFWGLYVHVGKMETLRDAYRMAKRNNGAPGIDGVTFEAIEAAGFEAFLKGIRGELVSSTYWPMRNRRRNIPKDKGKVRTLGIPTIRDRVVQGALKLILEPVFEADFQPGSYGYRPKRTAQAAVNLVAEAVVSNKTRVIDVDLKAYLNEVYKMLERAKAVTRRGPYEHLDYARYADDLVILVDGFQRWDWLAKAAYGRLLEELGKLDVQVNPEKTRIVDLTQGETFSFLGFDFRRSQTRRGKWGVRVTPKMKARTALLRKLKEVFRRHTSQAVARVIYLINPILRGWVNYFRIGGSSRCFGYIKYWVEKKIRRHLMRARKRPGFGWDRWSKAWLYQTLGLFDNYRGQQYQA